ncbi:hypothetical protein [Salinirarus marinus]|uniref:hypothetical protein n=1 Tax=Salinirarus marinus TaxID=3068310 RepID=UPI003C6C8F48
MHRLRKPLEAGSALIAVVLVINLVEFVGLAGRFPGVGIIGVFSLAIIGVSAILFATIIYPFSRFSRTTSKAFVKFGLLLVLGYVPLYLVFGCVFYGCPG